MVQRDDTSSAGSLSVEIRVQFPVGPLIRKVAGYGWPGRFAKPCGSIRVMRVRIPCLPLRSMKCNSPMVKRRSSLASNEVFQVRILVGLLLSISLYMVSVVYLLHAWL